jgi:hypothetical protein
MKTTFLAILLICSVTSFAQSRYDRDNQPPASIQRSFQRDNPNVTNPSWERRRNEWHATYRDNNNREAEIYYDNYGRRRDTHISWERTQVPREVDRRFNRRYHYNGDYRVMRIERPRSRPLFQITFQRGGRNRSIYMDERGRETQYYDHH